MASGPKNHWLVWLKPHHSSPHSSTHYPTPPTPPSTNGINLKFSPETGDTALLWKSQVSRNLKQVTQLLNTSLAYLLFTIHRVWGLTYTSVLPSPKPQKHLFPSTAIISSLWPWACHWPHTDTTLRSEIPSCNSYLIPSQTTAPTEHSGGSPAQWKRLQLEM